MNGEAAEKELLPPGTQVVVRLQANRKVFLIDGQPAPSNAQKMLGHLLSLPQVEATDDDVFGTNERKKVGDNWNVRGTEAVRDLAARGLTVKAENIRGSMKLEKAAVVDGISSLSISGRMDVDRIAPPLPPGFFVEKANASAVLSGEFPVDTSLGRLSETASMTIAFVGRGRPTLYDPEVTVAVQSEQSVQRKFKPLK
jgi:hypothetical protein